MTEIFESIFGKEPTEEEINKNIGLLLEYPWFREIYEEKELRGVIDTNKDVREIIGRANVKSLKLYPRKQLNLRNKITNAIFFGIK